MKIGDGELYRDKLIASPINANTTNVETVTYQGFSAVYSLPYKTHFLLSTSNHSQFSKMVLAFASETKRRDL